MKQCPYCSEDIQDSAKKCRYCGEWINSTNGHPHRELTESEVSTDVMKAVPTEVKGWNWGAFAFGWIWCIWNYKIKAALLSFILMFIPIVNVVQMIIFGLKGSEVAWKNRKSDDLKQFLENQKKWNRAAIIFILIICALLAIKIVVTNQTPQEIKAACFKQAENDATKFGVEQKEAGVASYDDLDKGHYHTEDQRRYYYNCLRRNGLSYKD